MEEKDTNQAYACWAATYDSDTPDALALEEAVVMSLIPAEVSTVLDAATGTGRYALRLAQMGKHVHAVDQNGAMLAQAGAKADQLGLAIDFRQASLTAIPLPDSSVELVVCAMTLAHIQDLGPVMAEFVRVLRVGGVLVISDLHPDIQKRWGPDYSAAIKDGRLLVDGLDCIGLHGCPRVPFPQFHPDSNDYVCTIQAAHGEVLSTIDIRAWQLWGLLPFILVVLARKSEP